MGCDPPPPPPEELPSPPVLVPDPGATTLITFRDGVVAPPTRRRDCDAVTAVKRGLKEYLQQVFIDVAGERVRFLQVFDAWAESDEIALYPSAAVMTRGEATFDASGFTPKVIGVPVPDATAKAGSQTYLVKYSEAVVPLVIEVHTSSPVERANCAMLLEDALNPVEWMYGFQLVLPHYFNQRVVYEPMTTQFNDTEDSARRRWRPGTIFLQAQISVVRPRQLPGFDPKALVTTLDPFTDDPDLPLT